MASQARMEEILAKAVIIDGWKEWYCWYCSETNVWTRSKFEGARQTFQLKNQRSIMQEDYKESVSLALRTWRSRKSLKKTRSKLETPMAPAMPCKTCKKSKHGQTRSKTNEFKSKFACILEASESTRLRVE